MTTLCSRYDPFADGIIMFTASGVRRLWNALSYLPKQVSLGHSLCNESIWFYFYSVSTSVSSFHTTNPGQILSISQLMPFSLPTSIFFHLLTCFPSAYNLKRRKYTWSWCLPLALIPARINIPWIHELVEDISTHLSKWCTFNTFYNILLQKTWSLQKS